VYLAHNETDSNQVPVMQAHSIAFNRPETSAHVTSSIRPIDLAHLSRQTMGRKDLEQEVLGLFIRQVRQSMRGLSSANIDERRRIAHLLKGSARGVGAFGIADAAERMERAPAVAGHVDDLAQCVLDVENFLLRLSR
jgi:HPt (histidine-containing phosphotransfer) domain-containing protein